MVMLIVFGGLPGSGKSSIACQLARETGAMWLRIDSIEQAIRESGVVPGSIGDAGYRAAYAIAADNLRLGCDVIADSVNGWSVTRNAWRDAGVRAGAQLIEVEIICSDLEEHRRRVETRDSEVPRLILPAWQAVIERDYEPWDRDHLTIDTAVRSVEDCARLVRAPMTGCA
jgi:predicted kinase